MAQFCIHLRISPAEYYALTWGQREALITEWNRINRKG